MREHEKLLIYVLTEVIITHSKMSRFGSAVRTFTLVRDRLTPPVQHKRDIVFGVRCVGYNVRRIDFSAWCIQVSGIWAPGFDCVPAFGTYIEIRIVDGLCTTRASLQLREHGHTIWAYIKLRIVELFIATGALLRLCELAITSFAKTVEVGHTFLVADNAICLSHYG